MTTQSEIIETLSIIKGQQVRNVDFSNGTFECGKSIFSFELTKTGLIKTSSVKFLNTISNFQNCSY
jgi:hypothetical protein